MRVPERKNIKTRFIYVFFIEILLAACGNPEPKVTESEAESLVLQYLTEDRMKNEDDIKIKSITNNKGEYIIKWEVDEHCEFGSFKIDDQNGEFLEAEETLC
ncbi:hypothetical protein [Oceanobacillus sp. CAU 1775]